MSRPWTLLICACIAGAGCLNHKPEMVYVDISALKRDLPGAPAAIATAQGRLPSTTGTVPGAPSTTVFLGLSETQIGNQLDQLKQNQDKAIQIIFKQRLLVLNQEIDSAIDAFEKQAEPAHRALLDDAIDRTRIPFDKYAPQIGKRAIELTSLVGFPDPKTNPAEGDDPQSTRKRARALTLRAEIQELNRSYEIERAAILDNAFQAISDDLRKIRNNAAAVRQQESIKLLAELRKIARSTTESISTSSLSGNSDRFDTTPPKSIAINPGATPPVRVPETPRTKSADWSAERMAKLFATSKGYTLVDSPSKGRDATAECREWMTVQWSGR